jgi:anion-transporting  ArsA/GET3 family ATPase
MNDNGAIAACLDDLASKRVVFVTGKGGTGKSTFCALLGRRAAERGVRTLLVELDSRSVFREMFVAPGRGAEGGRDGHGGVPARIGYHPAALAPGLFAVNIDSENAVVSYLSEALGSHAIAAMVINNRVIRYFYDAVPAGREIVVLSRLFSLVTAGRTGDEHEFDLFVVDMPASGHALSLLQLPATAAGAFAVGPVAKRARQMDGAFLDPRRSALVILTIPEEMAVAETVEFHSRFREECRAPVGAVVVNMVPVPFLDEAAAMLYRQAGPGVGRSGLPPGAAAVALACDSDMEKTARKRGHLRALENALPGVVSLPLIETGDVLAGLERAVAGGQLPVAGARCPVRSADG